MKHFFSIDIYHEYDMDNTQHLAIVPSISDMHLIQKNRVLFKSRLGGLECFIDEDELIKIETPYINFWIICNDEAFFNYTDIDTRVNFYAPYFYWSNVNSEDGKLKTGTISNALHNADGDENAKKTIKDLLNEAPKNSIGLLQVTLESVLNNTQKLRITFKVKQTVWQFNISPREAQKEWIYNIEDEKGEWQFERIKEIKEHITFQSIIPISYTKKASNRLTLRWKPEESSFEGTQSLILPFANYVYKMVCNNNKEITPIYIHI